MPLSVTRNAKLRAVRLQRDRDLARLVIALGDARGDALARILQHIGQRLGDQPAIAFEKTGSLGASVEKVIVGIGDALQEHRLLQQLLGILAPHHRRGHAGEGREFIHHAADIAHLAHDGVGALLEDFGIGGDLAAHICASAARPKAGSGVSGFLISWAMRRATSAQAAVRWALTRSVMSSKVTTKPSAEPRSLVTCTLRVRGVPPRA